MMVGTAARQLRKKPHPAGDSLALGDLQRRRVTIYPDIRRQGDHLGSVCSHLFSRTCAITRSELDSHLQMDSSKKSHDQHVLDESTRWGSIPIGYCNSI